VSVPPREELDAMTAALTDGTIGVPEGGLTYGELPVEQRIIVMQLTVANETAAMLNSIDDEMRSIGKFFRASKPYYP